MHALAHYSMLCKACVGHFIYGEFLNIKKHVPVRDYAGTIYQAALLQKSAIILRTEPGPAAPTLHQCSLQTDVCQMRMSVQTQLTLIKYHGSSHYTLYSLLNTEILSKFQSPSLVA